MDIVSPNQGLYEDVALLCNNHKVCQKLKAENECFYNTYRTRFTNILKSWNISYESDLYKDIIEILELIINQEFPASNSLSYCESIKSENELHTQQFFKASYFMECLEKSKLSKAHLHRISIFLQTKIFDNIPIKLFFEEMTSTAPLYECQMCRIYAPPETSLTDIASKFYLSVRNRCKECFKEEAAYRYRRKALKSSLKALKSQTGNSKSGSEGSQSKSLLISKIYLCMTCGEDNFVNFYERNKSKCKFCILQEKRGIYTNTTTIPGRTASKPYGCRVCHTEDPKNFRETYKSLCYACFLQEKREKSKDSSVPNDPDKTSSSVGRVPYVCKDCETTEPSNFRRGYKSQCYDCFIKQKKQERTSEIIAEKFNVKPSALLRIVKCKHCNDTNYKNFNDGMDTVCARCEEIELQSFICSKCEIESLRSNFTEYELKMLELDPGHAKALLCNLCNPEVNSSHCRKECKCENCGETDPKEFYSGFKGKCKVCTRELRREKYRSLRDPKGS